MKSSHWLWYACGAAKIVKTAGLDVDNLDHDTAALVGWVHYYNTLSRFSLRHWQPHVTLDADGAADSFHPVVCGNGQVCTLRYRAELADRVFLEARKSYRSAA